MTVFNLQHSLEKAARRLGNHETKSGRRPRADRGRSRLPAPTLAILAELCGGQERPPMAELMADLKAACAEAGLAAPSRATVYNLLPRLPVPRYRVGDLPASTRAALYNLTDETEVPAHQLAFHCFDDGDGEAIGFAAALPWLALYQALRMRGYRRRSRGLIESVARARRI